MARTVSERADAVLALAGTFRRHGFEGASLSVISAETGLGKGSLYNFFPGGKEEMALCVLDEVGRWFRENVYEPLVEPGAARVQISKTFEAIATYFESRHMVCLFGAFALGQEHERFAEVIRDYFSEWIAALSAALVGTGHSRAAARELATDIVSGIQGTLIVSRAMQDPRLLRDSFERLRERTLSLP